MDGRSLLTASVAMSATKSRAAFDSKAVFVLLNFSAHRAKVLDDGADSVGLFHTEFARVSNLQAARGLRADDGEQREFVYE